MSGWNTFLRRWGPALLVMLAIFYISSFPNTQVPDFGSWDLLVKKAGHLLGYGLLGLAYLRGVGGGAPVRGRHVVLAVALAAAYGVSDEFHQSFIAGRQPSPLDVLIDTAGAALAAGLWAAWRLSRTAAG